MSDASIHGRHTAELTTPILTYDDLEDLLAVARELRHAGAISNPEHGCGVHIHIGANGHTAGTLRNLANIMASHESLLIDASTSTEAESIITAELLTLHFFSG